MAIPSTPPRSAPFVYAVLLALGLLAAAVAASTLGYISYQYTTRPELRPVLPAEESQASLPSEIEYL